MATIQEPFIKSQEDMNRDEAIVYKPKLGYDTPPYDPGFCWQCRCVDCCCGCLLGNHVPTLVRCVDCAVTYGFYTFGMYLGGEFDRSRLETSEKRAKDDPTGKSGMIVRDMTIPSVYEPGIDITVRIFKQIKSQMNPRKVVYYIHGGGWCVGHPQVEYYHNAIAGIAKSGAIVVAIDYRLAPEYPFPVPVFDVFDGLRWIASKPSLDIFSDADMSKVILVGDSAGGNLCMVLSTLVRDGLGADLKPLDLGIKIEKQILLYPGFFLERFIGVSGPTDAAFLRRPVYDFFMTSYVPGATYKEKLMLIDSERRLCPLIAGFHKLPKTIILSGTADSLHAQNVFAVECIRKTGTTKVTFHIYPNNAHAFFIAGNLLKAAVDALKVITAEIQSSD